jgi:hypothetical protein
MRTFLVRTLLGFGVLMGLFLLWAGWLAFDVYLTLNKYKPQIGDVVIQEITPCGRLLRTVKGVTKSDWCHCGVVDKVDGQWVVCEAVGSGVQYTPLFQFLLRGETIHFAAYRLSAPFREHAPAFARNCVKYLGRPYDIQYELDDEKIYCSELVYKAYKDTTGETLGVVEEFGTLHWQDYVDDIRHYHGGGPLPLDRKVVTPVSLTRSPQLEKVIEVQAL